MHDKVSPALKTVSPSRGRTPEMPASGFPATRMRRTRQADWSRRLVRENVLTSADLIWPLFVIDGENRTDPVPSMPGRPAAQYRRGCRVWWKARRTSAFRPWRCSRTRIRRCATTRRAKRSTRRTSSAGPVRAIKQAVPEMGVICDVALDPYTSHGHDGIMRGAEIVNDLTIETLIRAGAGAGRGGLRRDRAVGHDGRARSARSAMRWRSLASPTR